MDSTLQRIIDELKRVDKNFVEVMGSVLKTENGVLIFSYESGEKRIKYPLLELTNLYEGTKTFDFQDDSWDGEYMPLLALIESTIFRAYKNKPKLKDKSLISILEALVKKPDTKIPNELLNSIQNKIRLNLSINAYSKAEVVGSLRRVLKSVKTHHSTGGSRGYLEFLEDYYSGIM